MGIRQKLKIYIAAHELVVVGCILATAYFLNKIIPATVFMISYMSLRKLFPLEFHARDTIHCLIYSCIGFPVFVIFSFPVQFIALNIPFACLVCTGCYVIADYVNPSINQDILSGFTFLTATEDQIRHLCALSGIKGDSANLCVDLFCSGMRHDDIAAKYNLSRTTITNKKSSYKKMISVHLK